MAKKVIDVSEHQGIIDWVKVKPLIDGAILRCGYGDDIASQDDKQFVRNITECSRLNIPFGVYIYSYADTDEQAKSEAGHVLRLIKGYSLSYPVYLDLEHPGTENGAVKRAVIFGEIIENAGYWCGIYSNLYWWQNYLTDDSLNRFTKWVARYSIQKPPINGMDMWQYTSKGKLEGIQGNVDISHCYRDFVKDIVQNTTISNSTSGDRADKGLRRFKIGDIVEVSSYYAASTDSVDKAVFPKSFVKGTITKIADGAVNNPYLLNNGAIGWCNDGDIRAVNGKIVGNGTVSSSPVYYTVKNGDTVSAIASKYGTTVEAVKNLNNLKDVNKIYVGEKLRIL